MKIQRKVIKFQIFINILFVLLTVKLITGLYIDNPIYNYGSLGLLVLMILTIFYFFKQEKSEEVLVHKKYNKIIQYNVYLYLVVFAISSFQIEDLNSFRNILFIITLFLSSILGIIYNTIVYFKSRT